MSDAPLLALVGADALAPLVTGGERRHVNLDYAASTPALAVVAEHLAEFLPSYSSVHRGSGYLSELSTAAYESSRANLAAFVGARPDDVAIVTRNTTDAINLLASVTPGPTLVLDIEHHANLLPWRFAKHESRVVRAERTVESTLATIENELSRHPVALVAVSGASNVTGEGLPLERLATIAHAAGARLAVDGAQLVPHRRINIEASGIDYLAFSGHKLYAPFGAGILVGPRNWFDDGAPYLAGGGAVRRVTLDDVDWRSGAARHEAGSPNVVGAVALARAAKELASLDVKTWIAHETTLRRRLVEGLADIEGATTLRLFSDSSDPVGVVTFTIAGADPALVAAYLSAEAGISVRDGRFCAHPLFDNLAIDGTALRASVGVGSRLSDIDDLIGALQRFVENGPARAYEQSRGRWVPVDDPRPRPQWAADYDKGWSSLRPPDVSA